MVLKPGIGLARENATGLVIGLGAGPVDLKFVLNTKVRLSIGASVLLPYVGISSQI